jgi:exopolysaccharide biosynthesis polyprenyl glycosylphosphotransferase
VNELRRRFLINSLKVLDLGLVLLSFGIATILVAHSDQRFSISEFLSMRVKLSNCVIFVLMLLAWYGLFYACGLYQPRKYSSKETDIFNAAKAVGLATVCLAVVAAMFPITMVTLRFLTLFWAFGTLLIGASRILLWESILRDLRHGRNLCQMLVIGTNPRALEFARRIQSQPARASRIVGFVDDDWCRLSAFQQSEFSLVCDIEGLPEFLRHNVVDEVAMYLPLRSSYERAARVAEICERQGIVMRFDGDIFSLIRSHSLVDEMEGGYYIATSTGIRKWGPLIVKRAMDIVLSLLFLVLFIPIFATAALLVWATSGWPIFYLQERVGHNKRRFRMYKFRTMIPNAEKLIDGMNAMNEVSGPVFKIKNDPRITPVGRILRRTSIDELPQLLNVLEGDMSIVGPRPLPLRDYEGFNEDWQRRRFSVRPGITCLWQIMGRSSISFDQWMKLDLQYMDEWSLWLDLKILLRTIPAVLKGAGAA